MDGVFVAYHNTARLFGFQYIPLDEMEMCLYGAPGRGDHIFAHGVATMEAVLDEAVKVYPKQVRSHFFVVRVEPRLRCSEHSRCDCLWRLWRALGA